MRKFNAICPVCGRMNRQLFLEETYGSFECEDCGTVSVRPAYSLVGEPEKQPDRTNVIAFWYQREDDETVWKAG